MNDPHVEALHYEIGTGSDSISYGEPPAISFENQIGAFNLADGKLTIELSEHFSDEQQARQLVDPFLRSWEIETDLTANLGQIRFTYRDSKIIDRDPPPPGTSQVIYARGITSMLAVGGNVTVKITCGKYPEPPTAFTTTPDVELAHLRWTQFREGKETLPAMAYFVLDLIQKKAGGQKQAAKAFQISRNVLGKVGDLSSSKGDANTARKADFKEMTGQEKAWLEHAVRKIIIRFGEHASGKPLDKITLADLPELPQ